MIASTCSISHPPPYTISGRFLQVLEGAHSPYWWISVWRCVDAVLNRRNTTYTPWVMRQDQAICRRLINIFQKGSSWGISEPGRNWASDHGTLSDYIMLSITSWIISDPPNYNVRETHQHSIKWIWICVLRARHAGSDGTSKLHEQMAISLFYSTLHFCLPIGHTHFTLISSGKVYPHGLNLC